jgi:RNA polymerase-binding transcription factor DksA
MRHLSHSALASERMTELRAQLREMREFRQDQVRVHTQADITQLADTEAQVNATVLRGAFSALAEIEAALERMDRGTYGRCTTCQREIALERLEVLPHTPRCTACERVR